MKVERPKGPVAPDAQAPVGDAGRVDQPAVSFGETLAGSEVASGAAAIAPESVEALVGRLRAGEIGVGAVLDTLVEQAVRGAPLGPRAVEQVREMLRSALESDPTLRALVREIEQG